MRVCEYVCACVNYVCVCVRVCLTDENDEGNAVCGLDKARKDVQVARPWQTIHHCSGNGGGEERGKKGMRSGKGEADGGRKVMVWKHTTYNTQHTTHTHNTHTGAHAHTH